MTTIIQEVNPRPRYMFTDNFEENEESPITAVDARIQADKLITLYALEKVLRLPDISSALFDPDFEKVFNDLGRLATDSYEYHFNRRGEKYVVAHGCSPLSTIRNQKILVAKDYVDPGFPHHSPDNIGARLDKKDFWKYLKKTNDAQVMSYKDFSQRRTFDSDKPYIIIADVKKDLANAKSGWLTKEEFIKDPVVKMRMGSTWGGRSLAEEYLIGVTSEEEILNKFGIEWYPKDAVVGRILELTTHGINPIAHPEKEFSIYAMKGQPYGHAENLLVNQNRGKVNREKREALKKEAI